MDADSATARWFARRADRDARLVLIEEALLAGRTARYIWYRLRGFGMSWLVDCATQAVLVLVAVAALPAVDVALLVAAHAGTTLAAHLWWGALEALRGEVRELQRTARPHRIAPVIAGWLTLGAVLGVAVVAATVLTVATAWAVRGEPPGPAQVYAAVLVLGLAVELPLRAYHSGVYATRRIHRPLATTFAAPVAGTAVLLLASRSLGPWAIVASAVATTLVSAGLTLHYTGRMYRFLGLSPRPHLGRATLRSALHRGRREAGAAGLANAVVGIDALLALGLLAGAGSDAAALTALFLALPTLTACAEWARLLYFDLKKLELRLFTNLRRRFDRAASRLAVLLGGGFGAVAAALALVVGHAGWPVALGTAVFVLARSVLAHAQIRSFAARGYVAIIVVGLAGAVGFLAARAPDEPEWRLTAAAVVAVACAGALGRIGPGRCAAAPPCASPPPEQAVFRIPTGRGAVEMRHTASRNGGLAVPGGDGALQTLEWLRRLGAVREPVRVGTAVLAPAPGSGRLAPLAREEAARWRLAGLADRVARRLGPTGAAAWIGPDEVVWFERPGQARITAAWLQRTGGGLVRRVRIVDHVDGEEALLRTAVAGGLGRASTHLRAALAPVDVAAAVQRFRAAMPGGAVLDPAAPPPPMVAALPGAELRSVLADAGAFARDLQVRRRRSRFDVTPLCSGGELLLIFIAPPGTPMRARRRWNAHVRALNVRAAVAGVRSVVAEDPAPTPAPVDGRVATLRRSTLFGGLPTRTLADIARATGERRITAGTPVVVENEVGVGFFLIREGRAEVVVEGRPVATLGPGDHFGDIALIAGSARTATVVAATELRCLTLTSWDFRRVVESDPDLSWQLLTAMAAQLLPRIGAHSGNEDRTPAGRAQV